MEERAETRVGVRAAKTHFSELLRRVEQGDTITLVWRGRVVARLVPDTERREGRPLGLLRGQWTLPPDNVLMGSDPEIEALFYGDPADE